MRCKLCGKDHTVINNMTKKPIEYRHCPQCGFSEDGANPVTNADIMKKLEQVHTGLWRKYPDHFNYPMSKRL